MPEPATAARTTPSWRRWLGLAQGQVCVDRWVSNALAGPAAHRTLHLVGEMLYLARSVTTLRANRGRHPASA